MYKLNKKFRIFASYSKKKDALIGDDDDENNEGDLGNNDFNGCFVVGVVVQLLIDNCPESFRLSNNILLSKLS